jgi:predicted outer membrane repeat protein
VHRLKISFASLIVLLMSIGPLFAITINVPADQSTIQAGLNTASDGDTVLVAPGTYFETLTWPSVNGIVLTSSGDSSNTIIDAQQLGSVITFDSEFVIDTMTVVSKLTIRNGQAESGGGVFCDQASPKLIGLSIEDNESTRYGEDNGGGGIYCFSSSPSLIDVTIIENNSMDSGGGIYCHVNSHPSLRGVTITQNNASSMGGGVYCHDSSSPSFTDVMITENSGFEGGGIFCCNESFLTLINVVILRNNAEYGGGILCQLTSPTLTGSTIAENAAELGGGIYFVEASPSFADLTISGNFASEGGAIYCTQDSSPILTEVTIVNNSASGEGDGIYISNSSVLSIGHSTIFNSGVAIQYAGGGQIDATDNWWGDPSGPFHPIQNSEGLGDSVSQSVNITPWLTTPDINAPVIPVHGLNAEVGNEEFTLMWNPSLLSDLAGYRVYFDTDSLELPSTEYFEAGLDTFYLFSDLTIETEYFTAVTCIDTNGNESWYSFLKVITGLGSFLILEPENNSMTFSRLFRWNRSTSPDPEDEITYFLEWSEDETFSNINTETFIDTFGYVHNMPNNRDIFWRVRASGRFGNEGFCDDYSTGWSTFLNAPEETFNVDTEGSAVAGFTMLGDDILYVPSSSNVIRMDENGSIEYTLQASDDILASTTITADHTVYIASSDNFLFSFNSNGLSNDGWPVALGSASTSSVAIDSNSIAYIGTENGIYQAIHPNGDIAWGKNLGASVRSASVISSGNILYAINENGRMFAFDLSTLDPTDPQEAWRLELGHSVISSPALDSDGNIYVTTEDGFLLRIVDEGTSASIDWSYDTELTACSSPVIDSEGVIYFSEISSNLFAVNSLSGDLIWESDLSNTAEMNSTLTITEYGLIYTGDSDGYLYCVSSVDGSVIWHYTNDFAIEGPLLYQNNHLYYCSGENAVSLREPLIPPEIESNLNIDEMAMWPTFQGNNLRTGYQSTTIDNNDVALLPTEFAITNAYPNPFNPTLTVVIGLPITSDLRVVVYNIMGREIAELTNRRHQAGYHNFIFDGSGLSSGVYFVQAFVPGKLNQVQKVVLMK